MIQNVGITVTLPLDLVERARSRARREERSVASIVRVALDRYLKETELEGRYSSPPAAPSAA